MKTDFDVIVIGAGPVGLFAVFQAGMLGLSCAVIDTLEQPGGQCTALYPEKPIYDIPAWPRIPGQALIDQLVEQAAPFHPNYFLNQQVMRITRAEDGKQILETSLGHHLSAGAVIVAAGCGAFGPNRPPLENLDCYEGKSIFYLVKKRADFAGKKIMIAGGGDSALDWAISLSEIAEKTMLLHRRPKFRAAPESLRQLDELVKQGKIELVVPYQLDGLVGDSATGVLTGVTVATLEGEKKTLATDILLPFYGLSMELGPIAEWGLALDKNHITVDAATCATSAAGIYAIGDIAQYPGKLKLILCGFSEAAMACHAIRAYLQPDLEHHFEYSTTRGVPNAA